MSHVKCHMSHVKCHVSHVTWHNFYLDKVVELVGGGSLVGHGSVTYQHLFKNCMIRNAFAEHGLTIGQAGAVLCQDQHWASYQTPHSVTSALQKYFLHLTLVVWLYCDFGVTVVWLWCDCFVNLVWLWCDCSVTVVWQWCFFSVTVLWL